MSKESNTLLFILGATLFNMLITVISFVLLLLLYAQLLAPLLPETGTTWAFPIIFIGAIALAFVVYRLILKRLVKRIDMEKYFAPIFGARKPSARRD
ncbi:MAG: leader peptide processing enzyme [Treponema sp.]|jgi:membrane protein implicated in regulation of membrane protease activity|nr:leader peptide processing enzyme [Treponema sp.]